MPVGTRDGLYDVSPSPTIFFCRAFDTTGSLTLAPAVTVVGAALPPPPPQQPPPLAAAAPPPLPPRWGPPHRRRRRPWSEN